MERIPHLSYDFVSLADIDELNINDLADVIGMVIYVGDEEEATNTDRLKRDVYICDETDEIVKCVLWESHLDSMEIGRRTILHRVIAVKQAIVKVFNNQKHLSIVSSSTLEINPDRLCRTKELTDWFAKNKGLFKNFKPLHDGPVPMLTFDKVRNELVSNAPASSELIFINENCSVLELLRIGTFTVFKKIKISSFISSIQFNY